MTFSPYEVQHAFTFLYQEGLRWGLCNRLAEPEGQLVDPEQYEQEEPWLQFVEECWVVLYMGQDACTCQTEEQATSLVNLLNNQRCVSD